MIDGVVYMECIGWNGVKQTYVCEPCLIKYRLTSPFNKEDNQERPLELLRPGVEGGNNGCRVLANNGISGH